MHLYIQGRADLTVAGQSVTLAQTTEYPWDGRVAVSVSPAEPTSFRLRLRLPGWCRVPKISLNGTVISPKIELGYAVLEREWQSGDTVTLELPMPVERIHASPRVSADRGRVALQRGPIVYCLEAADNGTDLDLVTLPPESVLTAEFKPDLLGRRDCFAGRSAEAVHRRLGRRLVPIGASRGCAAVHYGNPLLRLGQPRSG